MSAGEVLMHGRRALLAGVIDIAPMHEGEYHRVEREAFLCETVFVAQGPFLIGPLRQDSLLDQTDEPLGQNAARDLEAFSKSSNRQTPMKASRRTRSVQRSPTAESARASEQCSLDRAFHFMVDKLALTSSYFKTYKS